MKKLVIILALVLTASFVMLGCGKKGPDTSRVEKSFATAEPDAKQSAQQAVDATKAGKYAEAMSSLQQAAAKAKLTPEQQAAIKDLVEQIQQQIKQNAEKLAADAKEGAQKALGDLQKSLNK